MTSYTFLCRDLIQKQIKVASDRRLQEWEANLTVRMGNINKFCPWPALELSIAQDIAMIWREQRFREQVKQKQMQLRSDIEWANTKIFSGKEK